MALDFTNIKDQPGAAIFMLHDGSEQNEQRLSRLMHDVMRRTKKQCIVLSGKTHPGSDIINFYSLKGSHFVLIVRDDDQLHHVWSDGERLDASTIAYSAEQAG